MDSFNEHSDSIFPSQSYGATQFDIDHEVSTVNRYNIQQESIKVIDDKVLGSDLGLVSTGKVVLEAYTVEFLTQSSLQSKFENERDGFYQVALIQNNMMLKTVVSSGTLIGNFSVIGGLFGFMYGVIYLAIGGFQEFAYENKLYRHLYTQSKKRSIKSSLYAKDDYETELEDTIMNRKQLDFHYFEHCLSKCMIIWCCCSCVKVMDCYKRRKIRKDLLEEANDRLSSETDILHFVRASRIPNFITLFSLRQNQRQLV